MAEKKYNVPNVLPILPVRDTVLFPGAVLPLTVGRESSLALVNSLSDDEKYLGVVAQLDPRIEDPAAADLHKVGTFAKVHKTVKMPNGNVVIFLEGIQRIQVVDLIGLRPFLQAQVQEQVSQNQREYLLREQMKAIQKELGEVDDSQQEIDELRKKVEEAQMTAEAKKECDRELKRLAKMTAASAEYMVTRTYLEWMTSLPWSKSSGSAEIDISKAQTILNEDHY